MAFPRARALPPRLNVTLLIVAAACEPREHVNGPGSSWYERTRLLDATADGKLDTLRLRASGPRGDSLNVTFTVVSSGREVVREEWGSDYMLVDPPFERPTPQAVVDSFIRAQLDTTLGRAAMHPVADLQFRERWPPVQSDCEEDPRDCIASVVREEAAGVDWSKVPRDSVASVRARIDNAPFDTAYVLAIANDIRQNTRQYLSLSYGYESTVSYAWSPRAKRFFLVFACC